MKPAFFKSIVLIGLASSLPAAADPELSARPPLECHGNQSLVLDHVRISGPVAVNAHGNCSLVIRNSQIEGSAKAIEAHGNASVRLVDSVVKSPKVALEAHGNAAVYRQRTKIVGKVKRYGNARIVDGSDNPAPSQPPPKHPLPKIPLPKLPYGK